MTENPDQHAPQQPDATPQPSVVTPPPSLESTSTPKRSREKPPMPPCVLALLILAAIFALFILLPLGLCMGSLLLRR